MTIANKQVRLVRAIACELLGCSYEDDGSNLYDFKYDNEKFTITGEIYLTNTLIGLSNIFNKMNALLARMRNSGTQAQVAFCPPVEEWNDYTLVTAKFTNFVVSIGELRSINLFDVGNISDIQTITYNGTTINVSEYAERYKSTSYNNDTTASISDATAQLVYGSEPSRSGILIDATELTF